MKQTCFVPTLSFPKLVPFFFLFLVMAATSLLSCSESDEVDEYAGWRDRNQQFVDSVARVARSNTDGTWAVYPAFNMGDGLSADASTNYFVYVQKLEQGSGSYSPVYSDSVRVHYSGRLISSSNYSSGYCFDKSFSGTSLNVATDVPNLLGMGGTVTGFSTALMHMVEGDHCLIIVPYYLGYGENGRSAASIPGYSTLIFDVKLAKIYRYKVDTDTSWW